MGCCEVCSKECENVCLEKDMDKCDLHAIEQYEGIIKCSYTGKLICHSCFDDFAWTTRAFTYEKKETANET